MKIIFTTLLICLLVAGAGAQNVGINTTSPQAILDVNGDLALRAGELALASGTNSNIDLSVNRFSFYNITGSGAKTLTGFAGGKDGRIVTLYNNSDRPFILAGNDLSSAAANRISLSGSINPAVNKGENITLIYNAAIQKWVLSGSAFDNNWKLTGNADTDSTVNFLGTTNAKPLMFRVANGYAGRLGSDGAIAIGRGALKNFSDESIVAIGDSVLYNNGTVASVYGYTNNTGIGSKVLAKNTYGDNNTAVGYRALYKNTSGGDNTVIGAYALMENTSGTQNEVFGRGAMESNTTGGVNVAIGRLSMSHNTTGNGNTTIGHQSLYANISGNYNTCIGYQADMLYSNINNCTAIGAGARVANANSMVFGDLTVKTWAFGRQYANSGTALQVGTDASNGNGAYLTVGGVWTNASDSSKKEAITQLSGTDILAKIKQLPVTRWKYKGSDEYHIGPMAQDFYNLFEVGTNNTTISSIDPAGIALKAVQEQQEMIEAQNKKINDQDKTIADLIKRIEKLESK